VTTALFYMRRDLGGGSTSYAVHLYEGMRRAGMDPILIRVGKRTEGMSRPFAKYEGVKYANYSIEDALRVVKKNPSLLVAPEHSKNLPWAPDAIARLVKAGMRVTVHDPNEFKVYDHLEDRTKVQRPICIRPTMRQFFKDAKFIPHPYVREFSAPPALKDRELNAISVARVSFVKRTDIILDANAMVPPEQQCVLRGAENRMFTKFKIMPRFPDWKQGQTGFPMTWGASARECARARLAVDLTYFPDDGGGSQYSFMEAWDAGTVCVLHEDWLRYKGEMMAWNNCLPVKDAADLAKVLSRSKIGAAGQLAKYVEGGYEALKAHDAVEVAKLYKKELNR
jgi:hypothetical protein